MTAIVPMSPFQHLHPSAPFIWRLTLVPAVVVGVVAVTVVSAVSGALAVAWVLGAVGVVAVAATIWYTRQRYRHWQYRIGDDALELRRGVWFRTTAAVPYHRIQQIDVEQGPLQRRYDVVTLRLRTASAGTDGDVPHIAAADAELLRSRLLDMVRAMSHDGL